MVRMITEYYEWLLDRIEDPVSPKVSQYSALLNQLYSTQYEYRIARDSNRAQEGVDLRHEFADIFGYAFKDADRYLIGQCRILELMVALAARCEHEISGRKDAYTWFWVMVDSLGLRDMTDDNYNSRFVDDILTNFMEGNYKRNGDGSLFRLSSSHKDMRKLELWYQMCWYLNEKL